MNQNETKRGEGTAKKIGGAIKKGVGKLVGDEQMEAEGHAKELEGEAQAEAAKAAERAKGKTEETVGAIKNRIGAVIGSDEMAAKGKVRELEGQERQRENK